MNRFGTCPHKGSVARLALMIALTLNTNCISLPLPTLVTQIQLAGNGYYVAPTGNDSNSGTQSQPWRTIQKAANTMVAGDSATVLAGIYNEHVQITRSGASGATITFQASGMVTMQGFTIHANYIGINGFDITNTPNDSTDGFGIFVRGASCVLENNYVHYATRGGILLFAQPGSEDLTSNCVIKNNRLYRNAQYGIDIRGRNHLVEGNEIWGTIQYHPKWTNPPSWVDADGIRFHGSGHVFRRNYIHDILFTVPENIDPHIDCFQTFNSPPYQEAASNILFEQNHCDNARARTSGVGKGFMLQGASNITIQNNIIKAYAGVNANSGTNEVTILNNTFVSDLTLPTTFSPVGIDFTGVASSNVKNNILFDMVGHSIYNQDSISQAGMASSKNLMYRSDGKSLWTTRTYSHANDLWTVNPIFINPAANNFHLQPNSPAVDAGIALTVVKNDFADNPRPQGSGYDIGAYELPVSGIVATPTSVRTDEIITYTITVAGDGNPITVTDPLPLQLVYLTSTITCPGSAIYDVNARQVTYSGTPQAGLACFIQISTRVATNQRMAVTNIAAIDNGPTPLQSVSATVILNGLSAFLPVIFASP